MEQSGSRTVKKIATALLAVLAAGAALAQEPTGSSFSLPVPDAERGRTLFVNKGCVVCHSVNGVGGQAGPTLHATEPAGVFDPLDFAARMWRGADAMLALQNSEFGYQIELSGQDIADLAAFAESHDQQRDFSEDEIPEVMQGWSVDKTEDRYLIESGEDTE